LSTYRLYRLDKAGRIEFADWLEAEGDDEAARVARARIGDDRFELWQGGRLLAGPDQRQSN
jgi:hypothetical protein